MVSAYDKGCGIAAQVVGNGSLGEQEPALGATGESFMDLVRCFLKSLQCIVQTEKFMYYS